MFTGLIEEIGEITDITPSGDGARFTIRGREVLSDAAHGDSIAINGVCLTVIDQTADSFTADVMAQTLRVSTLGHVSVGASVNLERAAKAGDRLGGHIVQGHVDGTARVIEIRPGEQWRVIRFAISTELAPLIVNKGSICLNGVSLTVSDISDVTDPQQWCEVSLIPETLVATTLGELVVGDTVNVETDIVARHVERMLAFSVTHRKEELS